MLRKKLVMIGFITALTGSSLSVCEAGAVYGAGDYYDQYEEIKREIWDSKPDKILYQRRTLKEIRTTISFRFWILFGIAPMHP